MIQDRRAHLSKALEANIRYDGREKQQYREVEIEYGVSATAEGSAKVRIGDTQIIAGVKLEMGEPYSDTPDQGNLMVNAELLPLSSPDFEPGPPSITAIELARVMDRAVRESGAIDLKKLCVKEGEQVWTVIIDICTINVSGNLFDTASLAIMAALKDAVFPKVEDGKPNFKEKTKTKIPINHTTLSVTVWKLGDHLFVDPLSAEEELCEARLTVGSIDAKTVCSLQKGGQGTLDADKSMEMIDMALAKAVELRKHLG